MKSSYIQAGWMALLACFILVWLDFRRVTDAVLCLLPVTIGFSTLFGVLHLINEALNPANIIVLPLMFGIGVDAGVHMLHRFRSDPDDRPTGLSKGTGKGIVLTGLSTIIGFAALTFAEHRGIKSLGLVLALGVGLTLVVCLTIMPAVLSLLRPKPQSAPTESS